MNRQDYRATGKVAVETLLKEAGVSFGEVRFLSGCCFIYTAINGEAVRIFHEFDVLDNSYKFEIQTTSYGAIDPLEESAITEVMRITGALFSNRLLAKAIKEVCMNLDKELEY